MSKSNQNSLMERFKASRWKGYIVIFSVFAALFCFYPDNNVFTWISARNEIRQQEKLMRRLEREIIRMDARIHDLSDDKDSLERFAREHFHFAEHGEDVYLVEE